jgi:serine/threonine protein kinase
MQKALEGKTLGHYQLQRCIGQGGMSEVYLAHDEHLHRDVAVKIVHRERTEDLARFQSEVKTLAALTHEHILPVYDYGQDGPWHYLVMAHVNYGTLADYLSSRGPLTPTEALFFFEQIASALQYAHKRGILHRDIKASNILLRDDTYAYLADFGIAKSLEQKSGMTQTGMFIGTPEYMAPELFEGQATQASDIYALGIVLYDMLTGSLPFTGSSPFGIAQKQMQEPPRPPSQLNPLVAPAVEQVVLHALEKDPQRRFQNVNAFVNAYRSALQLPTVPTTQPINKTPGFYTEATIAAPQIPSLSPRPQPTSWPVPAQQPKRRRRIPLLIALSVFVLFLILGGVIFAAMALGNQTSDSSPVTSTTATPILAPTPTATQSATTCVVNDSLDILNQDQICNQAHSLSYSLMVNTSSTSEGGDTTHLPQTGFGDANTIVINILVTPPRHGHTQPQTQVNITGGKAVPLTTAQYHSAVEAFNHTFTRTTTNNKYTLATIAAIKSLQQSGA